ncbi:MAG: hypothetical protein AAF410_03675 [Pseudomonadota bacterium]
MIIKSCLASFLLLCSYSAMAESEYRDPNSMDQKEYAQAREKAMLHEECMNDFSLDKIQLQADVRVIADHAMKECAPVLEELYNMLVEWNYPPEFGSYYVSGISNRNASRLLSNLMRYMAMPRQ